MANISKDYVKLKEISNCFTEETLKNILQSVYKGKEVHVLSWYIGGLDSMGDNYLSTVYKIKVIGTIDKNEVEIKMVVKSLPNNVGRRNTYRSTEFFANEIAFYTKIVPEFQKFLKDKNQTQMLCIPRHLASVSDGENDFIALEDVTLLGYEPIARQDCLNLDQCMEILKSMAKLHGISLAYKDQKKESFEKIIDSLHETYFSTEIWNWYKRFHERLVSIAKNAVAVEYPDSEAEKKLNSYQAIDLYKKASEMCNRKYEPTSVIVHGDPWICNFLTRKIPENGALLLDFQLTRCSSPILDLSTFLYVCTDKAIWKEKFDELLQFYHSELSNIVTLLGSNPNNLYPWSAFMNEVKEHYVFGVIFAMEIIPISLLDESEAFDLDLIKDDKAVDIADVWTLSYIKTQAGRLRLADIIVHAVENGFL